MQKIEGRAIAALLNPRPAVLVTCCDAQGNPNVLSVAWHTPLSHDPPLVGISIDMRRYSHALIQQSGQFVVNVVGQTFQEAIEGCGNVSGRQVNKFAAFHLSALPAHCVKPPLIAWALAHLECNVIHRIPTGDHTLFVAEVIFAQANGQCFSDAWDAQTGKVLLCLQRDRFGTWENTNLLSSRSKHNGIEFNG